MDTYRALVVDAYASEPLAGTAAGVVPDAEGLADERMRAVARELGAAETAFLLPSERADRRLRCFSAAGEVDPRGRAAVAAFAHLRAAGAVDAGARTVETDAGVLDVEVAPDGVVWTRRGAPTVREVSLDYDRVGEALGVDPAALRDVGADLPPAVAAAGPAFLCLPVNFLEHLGGAAPDADAVAALVDEHDAVGVYAFTFDALDADSTLHARCFRRTPDTETSANAGVEEVTATGTAAAACAAYLRRVGAFGDRNGEGAAGGDDGDDGDDGFPDELRFEQGHFLDRPGRVHVRGGDDLWAGGRGVASLDGTVAVPAVADDDIIEA